ncbi:MAG: hypothetical protein COY36_03360 [Zetaproteobacteria bacterium CG_4_10_14_0_2_um_filter_55_20]|nr:MAG: hypothetical protein COT53_10600 [Zetaproteobacteria bacterium CG08_land_8_20_14_0_20_55_17]PIY54307.1 MAG: hypothetical protein COZ01_00815 [Zetaproteobacteria bacterium CG_4_10_14_0_8_um_filter_55_43]PIZ39327.1 MAG: hypothetical protein COY36_03360 [Zetaproteobacteria bacterium CG_4_10_14_0_2_um_filter_55_20]
MEGGSFQELSLEAAKSFLQSVVVVDDEAYLDKLEPVAPRIVVKPKRGASLGEVKSEGGAGKAQNSLNAKELIDKFADDGLVCAVLKPAKRQGIKIKVDRATQRADIVILDWKIYNSIGDETLEIIEKILSSDESERIRLIAIYTGEPDLVDISERITTLLSEVCEKEVMVTDDKYTIDAGLILPTNGGHPN